MGKEKRESANPLDLREKTDEVLRLSHHFLEITNRHSEMKPLLEEFVDEVHKLTGCKAVGLRILDDEGTIPYHAYKGFSAGFYESECNLSINTDTCFCINVITGKVGRGLPIYTTGGSVYINGTTRFLANASEKERLETRNVCNKFGYESVALIPIRVGDSIHGLIHIADTRENMVPLELVEVFEGAAKQLGSAIERVRAQEELNTYRQHLEQLVAERTTQLRQANVQLRREIDEHKQDKKDLFEKSKIVDSFFEFTITPVALLDKDFNFIRVNEAYARAGARDVSEYPGHNHFEFYPSDAEVIFKEVVRTKKPFVTYGRPFTYADHPEWGTSYWDWTLVPVLDEGGEVDFLVFSLEDVSERVYSEQRLKESERKYRELTESLSDMIFEVDLSLKPLYVSNAFFAIFGYTPADYEAGITFEEIVAQSDHMKVKNDLETIMTAKEGLRKEYMFRRKDGSLFPGEVSVVPVQENGDVAGLRGILRDITKRKQAQEKLRLANLYNRSLIEASVDPLVTIGPNGRITDVNAATETVTGYSREELIGNNFSNYFTDPKKAQAGYKLVFQEGVVRDYPLEILHRSGHVTPVLYNASVYRDENGDIAGVFAAARDISKLKQAERDITELKRIEDELQRRTDELAIANKELESFAYSVSHDLRAPLRSMDGFSAALMEDFKDKLGSKGTDYLNRVRSSCQRMAQLIEDLLILSRITRAEMRFTQVDLSALGRVVAGELQQTDPERNAEFVVEEGMKVSGDENLLRVMIHNLLDNAWKFTRGVDGAKIEFGTVVIENTPAFFIRDNGAGFDMEFVHKLFGPFQRLHSVKEFPGTGIGLATVQRIISRHGGRIWAEGKEGKGAVFYFAL